MISWLHFLTPYLIPWGGMHRWILFFKLKLLLNHFTSDVARFGEWVWAWKLKGWENRFSLESGCAQRKQNWKGEKVGFLLRVGVRRASKNEEREKKERKGKGRKEERRKREKTCVVVKSKKTKGEDDPPKVRVFVALHCSIQHCGS